MRALYSRAKDREESAPRGPQRGGKYGLPKSQCASRAQWRVLPRKEPERLSPYYSFPCEFGSSLTLSWKNDGCEPIYVCEEHAAAFRNAVSISAALSKRTGESGKNDREPVETSPARPEVKDAPEEKVVPQATDPSHAKKVEPCDAKKEEPSLEKTAPVEQQSKQVDEQKPSAQAAPAAAPPPQDAAPTKSEPLTPAPTTPAASTSAPATTVSAVPLTVAIENPVILVAEESRTTAEPPSIALGAPHTTAKPARLRPDRSAAIDQLIAELAGQLEKVFSQSGASLSVVQAIDAPLERVVFEIIGSPTLTDSQKDAAVQQLGALQESLKQNLPQDITLPEANRIRQTVGNSTMSVEEARPGYRAVYDSLELAIHAAAPKAKHLEERLANLQKMKADLAPASPSKERPLA